MPRETVKFQIPNGTSKKDGIVNVFDDKNTLTVILNYTKKPSICIFFNVSFLFQKNRCFDR